MKSSLPGGLNSRSPYYINDCVSLSTVAKSLVEQVWHQSLGRIWGEDSCDTVRPPVLSKVSQFFLPFLRVVVHTFTQYPTSETGSLHGESEIESNPLPKRVASNSR